MYVLTRVMYTSNPKPLQGESLGGSHLIHQGNELLFEITSIWIALLKEVIIYSCHMKVMPHRKETRV